MLYDVAAPVYLPMLAASGAGKLQGEWAAEPKLDGWRAIVTVDPCLPVGIEVRSRTGRFLTTQVPELHGLGERMLMRRPTRTVTLCAFDVLWLDGIDCTQLPYRDRRRVLEMLELSGPVWCTVPRFPFDDAEDLLDACVRLRQEGIVLKRLDACYTPGVRTDAWRKVKTAPWRRDHAPRRLPNEIRERIVMAQLSAMRLDATLECSQTD